MRCSGRAAQLRAALLFLIGVKLGPLGDRIFDQLIEPINRQLIRDRGSDSPVLLELLVEFDTFVTHAATAFARVSCPWLRRSGRAFVHDQFFKSGQR
jgi:hypothetical protein